MIGFCTGAGVFINTAKEMARHILDENHIHPDIRAQVAQHHQDIVHLVQAAMENNAIVVVGMAQNPAVFSVRKALTEAGLDYAYLEFGGYFSQWRRRNALKMWTGWPTFPMVFHQGVLLGGHRDTKALLAKGALS
jgi:glutaredoxin-related protein